MGVGLARVEWFIGEKEIDEKIGSGIGTSRTQIKFDVIYCA